NGEGRDAANVPALGDQPRSDTLNAETGSVLPDHTINFAGRDEMLSEFPPISGGSHDRDGQPPRPSIPTVDAAHATLAALLARKMAVMERLDRHEDAARRMEKREGKLQKLVDEARRALVDAVYDADPAPRPTINEWSNSTYPFWRVRSGDLVF